MKKLLIIVPAILIAGLMIVFLIRSNNMRIDTDFATSVSLKYHYIDKAIDVVITDDNDIKALEEMLTGRTYKDNPSCGFSLDISITLTDGQKNITFCPALDGCPIIRINDSNRYIHITTKQRKLLDDILRKYGMVFPSV